MADLSKKQEAVRNFIASELAAGRSCPTHREIAGYFGFASSYAAACHVKALVRKGALIAENGKARALRLADAFQPVLHAAVVEIPLFGSIPAGFSRDREQEAGECVPVTVESIGFKPTRNTFALRVAGGRVVCVHLRDRNPPPTTQRVDSSWTIKIECIGEEQCLALGLGLISARRSPEPPSNGGGVVAPIPPAPPARPPSGNARQNSPESSQPTASTESAPATSIAAGIEPTIMLGEKTGGEIITWQPYRNGQPIYNPHTVIVGGSGSGKTETLKVFLWELTRAGIACLVFDFKDDYVQPEFAAQVSATVHLAEDGLPLNPMVPGIDPLTGRCDVNSHVFNVEGTLTKVYGLGDQQANTLRQAFYALYDRAGFPRTPAVLPNNLIVPTFHDIRTELERLEAGSLIGRLSPIFDLNLFSAQGVAIRSLFSGMQIIRFTRLPNEEVKKSCAEILLLGCYNEILRLGHFRGLRLALVIDEAHRIANLAAVKLLLREARAYGVAVFLSSQQARDFSDDIYANADTLVGLKLNEIRDAERLGALLAGSQQARDLAEQIRRLRPGQAFIKNNQFQPYVKFQIRQLADRL